MGCKGRLKDFILDWEDALPEDELTASEEAGSAADLAICLGTSLQITPACDLPLRTPKAGKPQSQGKAPGRHSLAHRRIPPLQARWQMPAAAQEAQLCSCTRWSS